MSKRLSATEHTPLLKPPSGKSGSNSEMTVSASRRPPRPGTRSERGNASDAEGRQPPTRRQPRRKLVSESDAQRQGTLGGARIAPRGGTTTGSESDSERPRRPYHYHQVPGTHRFRHDSGAEASDCEVATFSRFNYISKVMGGSSGRLTRRGSETGSEGESEVGGWEPLHFTIPDHLIPAEFFIPYTPFAHRPRPGEEAKNGSLVTIFAIWNTMMGTSILSMPWLVEQSGLISSIATFIVMGIVCTFTAFRVLTMQKRLRIPPPTHDFQNIMRDVLSKHWEYFGILFSVAVLIGAMLVYWVLMTNFLYKSVDYFYDLAIGNFSKYDINTTVINGAYCPEVVATPEPVDVATESESFYDKIWNSNTAPLFLILLLYPLLNIKSPTFFTKFTGLGTISVLYMIIFVTTKAIQFGINASFSDVKAFDYVQLFRPNFPVAMGTLSLAMFIHNCICRIMESNEHQGHNVRDLFIAYFLVFITYLYIGLLFFLAWPFAKTCIQDNFLDNFLGTDPMSIVARLFLFFQMCTVFPLLGFMIRAQLMTFLFGTTYPGPGRVLLLNTTVVLACVVVAIFYPHIGQLLRFSGAFCGMAWIFTFPCITYLVGAYRRRELRWPGALLHSALIVLGVINLVLQFVVKTD